MLNTTTKISARIRNKSVSEIREQLDAFGCKTVTQFVQLAVTEKLERFTIGKLVEESIGHQKSINNSLLSALSTMLSNDKRSDQIVSQIADSLAKISAGFDALNKKS